MTLFSLTTPTSLRMRFLSLLETKKDTDCPSAPHIETTVTSDVNAESEAGDMAFSLKIWSSLVALLCLQGSLHVHARDFSRKEFMAKHYLNPNQEFHAYRCDVLMREKDLKHKISHLFIHASWYKIKQVCNSVNWKRFYRNAYIWAQTPIKVLKCHWNSFTKSYREIRSYSYVQFHCNMEGYVESIEDMKKIDPVFY